MNEFNLLKYIFMLNSFNFVKWILPPEIVDEIADYHDYQKYYKPEHKKKFDYVLNDIIKMNGIRRPISAKLAKECWSSNYDDKSWIEIMLGI